MQPGTQHYPGVDPLITPLFDFLIFSGILGIFRILGILGTLERKLGSLMQPNAG